MRDMLNKLSYLLYFLNERKVKIAINVSINIMIFIFGYFLSSFTNEDKILLGGLKIINILSIIFLLASIIYFIFYEKLISKKSLYKRAKYLIFSTNLAIFLYFYNSNYESILSGIKYFPNWIPKSTYAFLLYFFIYIILNIIILITLTMNIKKCKVSNNNIEIEFEKNILEGLTYITEVLNNVMENNSNIYQNMDEIIEEAFKNISISDEIDIKVFFEFYKAITLCLFENTGINVDVRIENLNNIKMIKERINDIDINSLSKANLLDDIENEFIVQADRYVFVPISMNLLEVNVVFILRFERKDDIISSLGNIIFTLVLHSEKAIKAYLFEKELDRVDCNLSEEGD